MTKMNAEMKAYGAVLARKHSERMQFRAEFRAKQLIVLEEHSATLLKEESVYANKLRKLGATHKFVQDNVGISNWDAYKTFMSLGADFVDEVAVEIASAQEVKDAQNPFELVEQWETSAGPRWVIREKASGREGSVWTNNSGTFDIDWSYDDSLLPGLRAWYREVTGLGRPEK